MCERGKERRSSEGVRVETISVKKWEGEGDVVEKEREGNRVWRGDYLVPFLELANAKGGCFGPEPQ